MPVLNVALSRMPETSTIVISATMPNGQDVEDDRDAEDVRRARRTGRASCAAVPVVGRQPVGNDDAEARQQRLEVVAPADRDGDVADGVLDDQVPADDPGDQLAERRVGVGVGGAGDRHHRRELGVAERGEPAGDAR